MRRGRWYGEIRDWRLGVRDWGLEIRDWGLKVVVGEHGVKSGFTYICGVKFWLVGQSPFNPPNGGEIADPPPAGGVRGGP